LTSDASFARYLSIDGGHGVVAGEGPPGILALQGGRDELRFLFLSLRDEILLFDK
jgi:hypothetical protein